MKAASFFHCVCSTAFPWPASLPGLRPFPAQCAYNLVLSGQEGKENKVVLSPGEAGPAAGHCAPQSQLIVPPADRKADEVVRNEGGGRMGAMDPGPGLRRTFQAP